MPIVVIIVTDSHSERHMTNYARQQGTKSGSELDNARVKAIGQIALPYYCGMLMLVLQNHEAGHHNNKTKVLK